MRWTTLVLIAFVLLTSCGHLGRPGVETPAETKVDKGERQDLIEELKKLQAVLASNDKNKIADLFSFPLTNETVAIYIDDSTYNAQYEQNGNKVSRSMFLNYYEDISESLQVSELSQLLKKLPLDDLEEKDKLEQETIVDKDPCYTFYKVSIEQDLVTLTVGTDSNDAFKSTDSLSEEPLQNSSEFCEHVRWWIFEFDGKKLRVKEILAAG